MLRAFWGLDRNLRWSSLVRGRPKFLLRMPKRFASSGKHVKAIGDSAKRRDSSDQSPQTRLLEVAIGSRITIIAAT